MSDTMTERTTLAYGARCPHRLSDGRPCPGRLLYATSTCSARRVAGGGTLRRFVCNGPHAHTVTEESDAGAPPVADELGVDLRGDLPDSSPHARPGLY
jgi:hypothetical protein